MLKLSQVGTALCGPLLISSVSGQSTGDTLEELYEGINEAMEGYIEVRIENGLSIPEPEKTEDYSSKFNVRLPRSLHQRLVIGADREGVILNQPVPYKLAQ